MAYEFEGWDKDLVDEFLTITNPTQDDYDEFFERQLLRGKKVVHDDGPGEHYAEIDATSDIKHYGTPRHSGRFPWGSGDNPQRSRNFIQRAEDLKKQGLSRKEIAAAFGMSSGDYVANLKNYKYQIAMENQATAKKLRDKGMSNVAIAEKLGVSEGTVRNYLDPYAKKRENRVANVAGELKNMLKDRPYLDIGDGVARQLGISNETLHAARLYLESEGYNVYDYSLPQVSNPTQKTKLIVLCDGDVSKKEFHENLGKVSSPDGVYFENDGAYVEHLKPIPSVDSKRISVKYDEQGGGDKDGVIEIRPGTEDLYLGGRKYAQVRIGVDGTHYLKGMAVYGDPKEMPPGVDIVFNTSKHEGTPVLGSGDNTVLKVMKKGADGNIDAQNPFGAAFRQWSYDDKNGVEQTSPINIVNDDNDWDSWKKNLSSQFLSKQLPVVAKKQLDLRHAEFVDEFNELKSLTNPTLKKQLLDDFADSCDAAAVHLKAAALPRQGSFAILPVNSLKDNEVYAPMYKNGEEVILVRHPHESITQIPRLIVNNDNPEGIRMMGKTPAHAIGINSHSANQLSGADYDGDTVLVIPTKGQKLKSAPPLDGLKDYNPSDYYTRDPNDPIVTGKSRDGKKGDGFNKGIQMGMASNLITDMTIKGATEPEIERAIKHSMCVIDAEKHNLDWKRSYEENGIAELKERYQLRIDDEGNPHYGASTLISRAKGPREINERKEVYGYNMMTDEERERWAQGEKIYRDTGRTKKERKKITDPDKMTQEERDRAADGEEIYRDTGKIVKAKQKIENMAAVSDAYELSAGYVIENIYADYANSMKALANEARKESRFTGKLEQNKSAAKAYEDVVGPKGTLSKKIELAELEAPKERQAQIIATSVMRAKVQADPTLKAKDNADKYRKLANKELEKARDIVNGGEHKKRFRIELTDREWEAIQAGAISENKFKTVLRYSDKDKIKQRALPRENKGMAASTKSRARMLLNAGNSVSEVAEMLNVSTATLAKEFNNFQNMTVGGD